MANFSFANSSTFRPFSYQEMLQPMQAYTEQYNMIQDGISEYGAKADVFDKLANQETDPETYAMYKKYSEDLSNQASTLAKEGLNPASRQGLLDMKRRYSSEIVPIEQAYQRRQALIDEQRKAKLQDDTLMFDRDASQISLDELIKDNTISPQSVSGANLMKMSGVSSSALAKEMRNNPRAWKSILNKQYFETMMQKGATKEEVLAAMQGDMNANPELRKILDDTIGSSGIANWKGVKDKEGNLTEYGKKVMDQAYNYAGQGLWQSIGETTYQTLVDQQFAVDAKDNKDSPTPKSLPYRAVPKTKVKATKHNQFAKDRQFLKDIAEGKVDRSETRTRDMPYQNYSSVTGFGFPGNHTPGSEYNVFEERVKDLTSRYGTTDPQEIEAIIQKQEAQSAIRDYSYVMNSQDSEYALEPLMEGLRVNASNGSYPIQEIKSDGTVKNSKLDEDDLASILANHKDGNSLLKYESGVGMVLVSTNKKGAIKSYVIDPETLQGPNKFLTNSMKALDYYAEAGKPEEYNALINNMFTGIINQSNTRYQTKSRSSSKPY